VTPRDTLEQIADLAAWHCDLDADANDESPEDMVAHVNGLIVRLCREAIERLDKKKVEGDKCRE